MKDFDVKITVKNNHLLERRERLGLTQRQLAAAAGVAINVLPELERMLRSPLVKCYVHIIGCVFEGCGKKLTAPAARGLCVYHSGVGADRAREMRRAAIAQVQATSPPRWSKDALALSAFFDCAPADIWPDTVLAVKKSGMQIKLDAEDLATFALAERVATAELPFHDIEREQLAEKVREALSTLTPRQEKVIRMRFGIGEDEKHGGEIGAHLDISGARGRQIENAALRRLRHPSRTKLLKDFVEDIE